MGFGPGQKFSNSIWRQYLSQKGQKSVFENIQWEITIFKIIEKKKEKENPKIVVAFNAINIDAELVFIYFFNFLP